MRKNITITYIVFFLSGCAALIFETAWFHVVQTVLGSSVWSAAAVLSAFMSGLAIGTYLVSIIGGRLHYPQRAYMTLEIIIGITGTSAVLVLPYLSPLLSELYADIKMTTFTLNSLRFLIAFSLLLVPATAMGATLPLLVRYINQNNSMAIKPIGQLYGWNTIGAVAGVLMTEYLLIHAIGIRGSALFATGLNLLAALLIFSASGNVTVPKDLLAKRLPLVPTSDQYFILLPFLSGATLLALEIIWFRYLILTRAGTAEIFALMLCIVLLGIGIGALLTNILKKSKTVDSAVYYLPLAASAILIITFYGYQLYFARFLYQIASDNFYFILAAAILMLPVSIISGMLFPVYGELANRKVRSGIFAASTVTFFNTIGAAIGSIAASFIFLPYLGIEKSVLLLALLYLVIATAGDTYIRKHLRGITFLRSAVFAIALITLFPYGSLENNFNIIASRAFPNMQLVKAHEGLNETLQYYQGEKMGQPFEYTLVTNGHPMSGSSFRSRRYMKYFAYFPYAFNSNIKKVLQISYGVGNTAEAVTRLPELQHFDVVDISEDIFVYSDIIHQVTGKFPLRDPRTHTHVEDGRFFLMQATLDYDLITAEPPPPQNAKVVNLYSKEYFQLLKDKLSAEGIVTYWLPVHSLGEKPTLSIIKGFCEVFADCSLWNGIGLEFMLVGSRHGLEPLSVEKAETIWASSIVDELVITGFESPEMLASTFMADPDTLKAWTQNISPVTDDYPYRIVGDPGKTTELAGLYTHILDIDRRKTLFLKSAYIKNIFDEELRARAIQAFENERLITAISVPDGYGFSKPSYKDLTRILEKTSFSTLPTLILGGDPREAQLLANAEGSDASNIAEYQVILINTYLSQRRYQSAIDYVDENIESIQTHHNFKHIIKLYVLSKLLSRQLEQDDYLLIQRKYPNAFDTWFDNFIFSRI